MTMQNLSLAFLTMFDVDPVAAIKIAAETGYQMVGLRILPAAAAGEPAYPLLHDESTMKEVLAALSDTGIMVGDVEIIRLKEQNDWDLFKHFCERSERLGARHILVAGDDTNRTRLTENFSRFCAMAEQHKLTADLEPMPWTAVPDVAAALAIVETANNPNGGVLVDALHFDRSSTTIEEIADIPRNRMNYVQLCDGAVPYDPSDEGLIRVARGERLFPGLGGIDLLRLVRAIPADITISVEVPHRAWAEKIDAQGRAAMAHAATMAILRAARTAAR